MSETCTRVSSLNISDKLIDADGIEWTVLNVYGVSNPKAHLRPLGKGLIGPNDRHERDGEWLAACQHLTLVTVQEGSTTNYWANATCYMDDDVVGASVYRMADDICDDGTTNLNAELSEIAAQLDRDAWQIAQGKREARYNRVVIEVQIEHGVHHKREWMNAAGEQLSLI